MPEGAHSNEFFLSIDHGAVVAMIERGVFVLSWGYSSVVEHLHGMQVAGVRFSLSPQRITKLFGE